MTTTSRQGQPASRRTWSRRRFLKRAGAAGGVALAGALPGVLSMADHGPCAQVANKTIQWIVPFSAGGGYDLYSRLIQPFYERKIGAQIAVTYAPGGGGIVGATTLQQADADGLTQGILNASGLLVAALTGEVQAPNPGTDFTILGRVVRDQSVWVTGPDSPFQTMEHLLARAREHPVLFGISEVGSTNFVSIAIGSSLLGIDAQYVAGFPGSSETSLAVIRGEVDLTSLTYESVLDLIEAGDLRPLLQISVEPISTHPALDGVALLGGAQGVAAGQAEALGRSVEQATAQAQALASLIGLGRLIAAPPGMEKSLFHCLEQGLHEALTDPEFVAAAAEAQRSLDVARADVVLAEFDAAIEQAAGFVPIVQAAIDQVRG
ncbi:MAG TPA: tripartite tricarboxylate transporter substrate-binding protein [Candidatus Bipolaricaulota bacterium]